MARKKKAPTVGETVQADRQRARRPMLAFAYNEPTVPLDWEQVFSWSMARIVRRPPQGLSVKELVDWRLSQGFTGSTRWFRVPDSAGGYVRKDKLEAIRALKPGACVELVMPRALPEGNVFLRVSWTAATGRKGWLSFVLDRPTASELVPVDREGDRLARERGHAERRALLEAEGQADDEPQPAELSQADAAEAVGFGHLADVLRAKSEAA